MKPPAFEYHAAGSVDEAVALLAEHGDDAKVLAGGQSLVPLLALRLARPAHLVDINRVADLATIANGNGLTLGAMVRHRAIERSDVVRRANPLLAHAVRFIGHSAIRNRGTIGGSIAHADPAAELPAVLVALDGEVEVASARVAAHRRRVRAVRGLPHDLARTGRAAHGGTCCRRGRRAPGWSFQEFSRRSGDFAIVGVAATVRLDGNGNVAEARLAFSGVDQVPVRATTAEGTLVGQAPSAELWKSAGGGGSRRGLEPPSATSTDRPPTARTSPRCSPSAH